MDERTEGVYVSTDPYPPAGMLGSTALTQITRVNGDCSVTTIIIAPSELPGLIRDLETLLQRQRAGEWEPR